MFIMDSDLLFTSSSRHKPDPESSTNSAPVAPSRHHGMPARCARADTRRPVNRRTNNELADFAATQIIRAHPAPYAHSTTPRMPAGQRASLDVACHGNVWWRACPSKSRNSRHGHRIGTREEQPKTCPQSGTPRRHREFSAAGNPRGLIPINVHTAGS